MIKFIALLILSAVLLQPSCTVFVKPIDRFKTIDQEVGWKRENDLILVRGKNDQAFIHDGRVEGYGTVPKPHIIISKKIRSHWGTALAPLYDGDNVVHKLLQIEYESIENQDVTFELTRSKKSNSIVRQNNFPFEKGHNTIEVPFTDLAHKHDLADIYFVRIFGSMKIFEISLIEPESLDTKLSLMHEHMLLMREQLSLIHEQLSLVQEQLSNVLQANISHQ